jgi:hypothetical protein
MSRAVGRLSRWLERVMDADERFICAACDDRFADRSDGITHVMHCHPEFATAFTSEVVAHGRTTIPDACPPRAVGSTSRPLMPVASWS